MNWPRVFVSSHPFLYAAPSARNTFWALSTFFGLMLLLSPKTQVRNTSGKPSLIFPVVPPHQAWLKAPSLSFPSILMAQVLVWAPDSRGRRTRSNRAEA